MNYQNYKLQTTQNFLFLKETTTNSFYFSINKTFLNVMIFNQTTFFKQILYFKTKQKRKIFFKIFLKALINIFFGYIVILKISGMNFKIYPSRRFLYLKLGRTHLFKIKLPVLIKCRISKKRAYFYSLNKLHLFLLVQKICLCRHYDTYKHKGITFYQILPKLKKKRQTRQL